MRVLYASFSPRNVIKRLFNEQLTTDADFEYAKDILWDLKTDDNINYEIVTSKYWLDRQDFAATSFSSEVHL